MMVFSLTPVVVIAAVFTQATITAPRFLLSAGGAVVAPITARRGSPVPLNDNGFRSYNG
jgi:hypothetical protein